MRWRESVSWLTAGLILGILGETVLFFQSQCTRAGDALKDDFRIVLMLKKDFPPGQTQVIADRLSVLEGVSEVRSISPDQALENLREEDPDMAGSIALVGQNPLPPSYELRLSNSGLERLSSLISEIEPLAQWDDILYKPQEAQAILQVQFYRRLADLALEAAGCLVIALALWALWEEGIETRVFILTPQTALGVFSSILGAAFGEAIIFFLAFPLKRFNPWWSWASPWLQAGLIVGAAVLAWSLDDLKKHAGLRRVLELPEWTGD